jgi:hypothetical protein
VTLSLVLGLDILTLGEEVDSGGNSSNESMDGEAGLWLETIGEEIGLLNTRVFVFGSGGYSSMSATGDGNEDVFTCIRGAK